MIIVLGLIILVAAVVVGVAAVVTNGGSTHALGHFSVFGYHLTGSTGTLFLAGIIVGAAGLFGLGLVFVGARRTARRGRSARRELKHSRQDTASAMRDRDSLLAERDATPVATTATVPDPPTANPRSGDPAAAAPPP